MNINTILFPRQLEADGSVDAVRKALSSGRVKLQPDGAWEVPLLAFNKTLETAIRKANLQRRVRLGLDEILEKLAAEKKGIDEQREKAHEPQTERISRLLIFSQDGADRLYRNIEHTLIEHSPRILGCMLNIKGRDLGRVITGKNIEVKVILIEHKDAVSDILRALA